MGKETGNTRQGQEPSELRVSMALGLGARQAAWKMHLAKQAVRAKRAWWCAPAASAITQWRGKDMKRILMVVLTVTGLSVGMVGCAEKTKVQETKKVETPSGTATETKTDEIKKTGDQKENPNP